MPLRQSQKNMSTPRGTQAKWMELGEVRQIMAKQILEGSRTSLIRNTALNITRGVRGGRYITDARLIFNAVRDGIKYTGDFYDGDVLQSAEVTLNRRAGDCNNRIVLLGALLRSIGYPVRLIFVYDTIHPPGPQDYPVHVYMQVDITKEERAAQWVDLEATPLGDRFTGLVNLRVDFGDAIPGKFWRKPGEVI